MNNMYTVCVYVNMCVLTGAEDQVVLRGLRLVAVENYANSAKHSITGFDPLIHK